MKANSIQRLPLMAAGLLLSDATTLGFWEETYPTVVPTQQIDSAPYKFTGFVRARQETDAATNRWLGSGAACRYPNTVVTAAHVVYAETAFQYPIDLEWHWKWNTGKGPGDNEGLDLVGTFVFGQYAELAKKFGQNSNQAFAEDFAVAFAFEDLAGGGAAEDIIDGKHALFTTAEKLITGYPIGLYDKDDPKRFLMRETGPFSTAFTSLNGTFLEVADVVVGGGNSGGPVWVKDGDTFKCAGVVVAGISSFFGLFQSTGAFAVTSNAWALVDKAFDGATPNNPKATLMAIPPIVVASDQPLHVRVVYSDADAIRLSSLDVQDIAIMGEQGALARPVAVTTDQTSDASIVIATYHFKAPDGGWTHTANGTYKATLNGNEVLNTRGFCARARSLGQFEIDIRAITGQWDFNDSNLNATVGLPLAYRGDTAAHTAFVTMDIKGKPARVMRFPAATAQQGFVMRHGAVANGGGRFVNQFSMVLDLMFPSESNRRWRSLLQSNLDNANDGEVFVNSANHLGGEGQYHGELPPDEWHRVALVFDVGAGRLSKYIDGQLLARQTISGGRDGRYSLDSSALLFTDDDEDTAAGYVNSIRFVNYALSDSDIAELGAASAEGIGIEAQPVLTIARQGSAIVITVSEPGQFQLLCKTSLTDRDWSAVGQPFTGTTAVDPDGIAGFWRAQKVHP